MNPHRYLADEQVIAAARQMWPSLSADISVHRVAPCSYICAPTPPASGTPWEANRDYWILKRERECPRTTVLHWVQVGPYRMIMAERNILLVMDNPPQEHA